MPLADNVVLADDPSARFVTVRRGVASTINTPALDPVLMLDGRAASLEEQAAGAIDGHAQGVVPSVSELRAIARFQKTNAFFSSPVLKYTRRAPSHAAVGRTASEQRGRRFFEDVPPDLSQGSSPGCARTATAAR